METENGELFIKSLAHYVRTHEKALAASFQAQGHRRYPQSSTFSGRPGTSASVTSTTQPPQSSTASTFASVLALPFRSSRSISQAKLTITPNQLYYLLSRFEELNVSTGPMNVRLEHLSVEPSSSNYVSFLTQVKRPTGRTFDQDSIHSVSSVRSVMSSMSSMWSNLSFNSEAKSEKRKNALLEDLRYLFSAFTKIPCLSLVTDHRLRRIAGFEEFPFDTAVPIFVFKNVTVLEIKDSDFRAFFGWDRLADQLRSLTVKRACLEDPTDLLTNVVLDDMDGRRRRSSRNGLSPVGSSPPSKYAELARNASKSISQAGEDVRPGSAGSPRDGGYATSLQHNTKPRPLSRSISPSAPMSPRRASMKVLSRQSTKVRRSSGSSTSSTPPSSHRNSSSNLLSLGFLPHSKWRFLSHLSLADNGLTALTDHSFAPVLNTLRSLDLSSNLFTEIPDCLASFVSLRAVNLSNCMIESLRSLTMHPLPAITVLNLKSNRISSLAGIERLYSLERLDLRDNRFTDPTELARLTRMPEFKDVYVIKNPFAKTHTNYRATIFNLFRRSPGYADDITIDSTGPAYSERRLLVDRVEETSNIPVVPPPLDDELESTPADDKAETQTSDNASSSTEVAAPKTPDHTTQGERRRKGPKRRVVNITQNELADSPRSVSFYQDSPDLKFVSSLNSPMADRRATQAAVQESPKVMAANANGTSADDATTVRSSVDSATTAVDAPSEEPEVNQGLRLSSEQYRRRIEELKSNLGNGWLSALDESWDVEATAATVAHHKERLLSESPAGTTLNPTPSSPAAMVNARRLG